MNPRASRVAEYPTVTSGTLPSLTALSSEKGAEVVPQRIEPDVLDGQDGLMTLALFGSVGANLRFEDI